MTNNLDNFINKAKQIGLNSDEKSRVRHMLVSKIEDSRPILQQTPPPDALRQVTGQGSKSLLLRWRIKPMPIFLVVALLFAGGAGTSLAAQNSLPGDALYTIKVNVNEKVRSALAISAKADGDVAVDQAEARLEEAEKLEQQSELKAEVVAQLTTNFQAHADRVKARIAELEAKGDVDRAAQLAANFETSLKVHDAILERLSGSASSTIGTLDINLKTRVKTEVKNSEEFRVRIEAKVRAETDEAKVKAAAQGRINAAENKIAEVERYIAHVKVRADLSAEALAKAEAKLAVAKATLADAKAKLDSGDFRAAFTLAARAHAQAQEAKLMVMARVELKIDVRGSDDSDSSRSNGKTEVKTDVRAKQDDDEDRDELKVDTRGRLEIEVR